MKLLQPVALLLLGLASAQNDPLSNLDDGNFEHETQASTGGTTGDWLVLFCPDNASDNGCAAKRRALADVAPDLEQNGRVVSGFVLANSAPKTFERFHRVLQGSGTGEFVLIARGRWTVKPSEGEKGGGDTPKELVAFAATARQRWESLPAGAQERWSSVPDELSWLDDLVHDHGRRPVLYGIAGCCMVLWPVLCGMCSFASHAKKRD